MYVKFKTRDHNVYKHGMRICLDSGNSQQDNRNLSGHPSFNMEIDTALKKIDVIKPTQNFKMSCTTRYSYGSSESHHFRFGEISRSLWRPSAR